MLNSFEPQSTAVRLKTAKHISSVANYFIEYIGELIKSAICLYINNAPHEPEMVKILKVGMPFKNMCPCWNNWLEQHTNSVR